MIRLFLDARGFLEVETPILQESESGAAQAHLDGPILNCRGMVTGNLRRAPGFVGAIQ